MPVGEAAWICDKSQARTDNDGEPEDALTRDEMLDVITLLLADRDGRILGAHVPSRTRPSPALRP